MESNVEVITMPDGMAEIATVMHEGCDYAAMGATINHDTGRLFAYVAESPAGGAWRIVTWDGTVLSTNVRRMNRWARGGWFAPYTYAIRFAYAGVIWSGVTAGPGTYVKARRTKIASL